MNKIETLRTMKNVNSEVVLEIFKDQVENNTMWKHLILTEEQYISLDKEIDLDNLKDILISIKRYGELDFIHYFNVEDMKSIKTEGLLVSYSKSSSDYIPDMGYGIYAIEGKYSHDMPDNIAELLLNRYEGDEIVGYVVGKYNGEYLECVNQASHEGYILLKEDISLESIEDINSDYISALAEDYYNYEFGDIY